MRIYIAGPMSGYPDLNFPAFTEAAATLRAQGHDVVSPHEIAEADSWAACMRIDIVALVGCEAVCVLPGWERSRGASLEVYIARALGMPIHSYDGHTLDGAEVRGMLMPMRRDPDKKKKQETTEQIDHEDND